MNRYITVAQAAIVAHRNTRTIYRWIDKGLLIIEPGDTGEILLDFETVKEVEETRRRGRPRKASKSSN